MELISCLLHEIEATIVIEDVSISTSAVGVVFDASISHHFLPVEVFGGLGIRAESSDWDVVIIFAIWLHFSE